MARRSSSLFRASVLPLFAVFLVPHTATAIDLDTTSEASISSTAQTIASSLISTYYNAASTAGGFNQPQSWCKDPCHTPFLVPRHILIPFTDWWLSGSGWTALMEYTIFTNDTTHTPALLSAISTNIGANNDFLPAEQAGWEANDDQAYWLYSALTALEYNFTALDPCLAPGTGTNGGCANSWLSLATNAFNIYTQRWATDDATCNGGMKWKFTPSASGYYYKNSVSNGGFFQTAARLARYTGNATYAEWASKIWDWTEGVGLISAEYNVYDGASDENSVNCTSIDGNQWSYNVATYMHGAAVMYAYSGGDAVWEARVKGLVDRAEAVFFSPPAGNATGVMYEPVCEVAKTCNIDQTSFKSSLARWMGKTSVLVPSVSSQIVGLLETSAKAAAASCTNDGTSTNVICGMQWWTADGYDGYTDFGTTLSALEVVQSLLTTNAPKLATLALS